jgi:GntR family transcriptional regulator, transcriptional repressor for pyruvate dehydrogenase complex
MSYKSENPSMPHNFTPVAKRQLLSKTVEADMEQAIRNRLYLPGSKLPSEFELCDQFGVSRTAVREALRMLSARGLVTIEKGRGVFVNKMTAASVTSSLELYLEMHRADYAVDVVHARQIIEPNIAFEAARARTSDDIKYLRGNLKELEESEDNHALLSALDMDFHLAVARATQNSIVPLLLEPIHQLMPAIKKRVYDHVGGARASAIEWHGKIVDAIEARDPEAAMLRMQQHLAIAEEHILRSQANTLAESA